MNAAEPTNAKAVVTDSIDQTLHALNQGKNVLLVKLVGPKPGVALGWWGRENQSGTAIASHPAFGEFPHEGYLNELFFRMVKNTMRLESDLRGAKPLMVGHSGAEGYLAYIFEAKAGKGKLFGCGLDLLANQPESACLLDQFIAYIRSEKFQPKESLDLAAMAAPWKELAAQRQWHSGWAETTATTDRRDAFPSFSGPCNMCLVRLSDKDKRVAWKTQPAPKVVAGSKPFVFRWRAAFGGVIDQPGGTFSLMLGDRSLVDFDVSHQDAAWKNPTIGVALKYSVKNVEDGISSGVMELTLPTTLLKPGEPAELQVVATQNGSSRWFGLYEYPPQ